MTNNSKYNSWEFIRKYEERKIDEKLLENEKSLEKEFKVIIENSVNSLNFDNFIIHKDTEMTPLISFLTYYELGVYPPPSVFAALAESFNEYERAKGKVELEEIFFGKPKRGIGNKSARMSKSFSMKYMFLLINSDEYKYTQSEAAEVTIADLDLDDDVDSFVRKYRRYIKSS